ncbi:isoprenylcysteine carboxylmethyltransferase family protein [Rhizobium sp. MC63]|uniref:Isoprenylcysteine carboxylmethyltransferase family protein n=1 Tax=Rhizobium mulingense TaxID=3031128 RepID=A0ACC6MVV2_9HYPH|nr:MULTISPECIES: isoprenylcysteine carboxylmethyltransferase family protein [unclassified Rhizobium]MDF0695214.1 isoprenylcysteine carboxylmethyltransferase family protein [Rhizobium sp. MC63]MEA3517422.1 isoprenylcysteine carboxylmethyltransferase family protein [Rhizobium sp. MJ31]MEB3048005.1 isoprenylcysteine carboxylmethyltransferase family protein [Rhizobium sp. MJ21]
MMWPSIVLLTFVTLQRLGELVLARRNTAALRTRGAREVAPEHYPLMVALHAVWIIGLWLLAPGRPIEPFWLAIFMGLQALRLWVLATLKDRWTTRIIILPGAPLIRSGPYRFLRHPNYAIVAGEIATLPLAFGLPVFAVVFSLFNAAILHVRIKVENAALESAMILK